MANNLQAEIDNWIDANNAFSFEGQRGVLNLEKLVRDLDPSNYGSLREFFMDNSGAVEAVIQWIASRNSPEWKESLAQYADLPEDGEEDEG